MHPVEAPRGAHRYLPGSDSVKVVSPTANSGFIGCCAPTVVVVAGIVVVVDVDDVVVVAGTEVTGTIVGVETGVLPFVAEEWRLAVI